MDVLLAQPTHTGFTLTCVRHGITYKLCLLIWKTLHAAQPSYLSELTDDYRPS